MRSTGQIGAILLRKTEKVKQGVRVEFVCGQRAVAAVRKDYQTLTDAAALYSAHIHDLPQQIRKSVDESRAAGKIQQKLLEEIAELYAEKLLAKTTGSPRIIIELFTQRDAAFIKLLAHQLTATQPDVVALLAAMSNQPAFAFAQSAGQRFNMGQLMKDAMAQLGGRGGGTADMAQGGLPAGAADRSKIETLLRDLGNRL